MTKEQILDQAMGLQPEERDDLAETLWQAAARHELTDQQVDEIRRRIEDLDNGRVLPVPDQVVMEELRQRYQRPIR